ncbi:hypothetical protein [Sphingomonas sp.]
MKAVIFALIVLLGVDQVACHGRYIHAIGAGMSDAGHEIGSWVFQT